MYKIIYGYGLRPVFQVIPVYDGHIRNPVMDLCKLLASSCITNA